MPTQKKLGPEGVGVLWEKVFSVMKSITGAVDVEKGTLQEQINKKVESDGDASNTKVDFQISSGRENISTGETIGRIFGKVSKWLADLKPHAFYDLIQNAATAATDRAVSAAVAKALQDQITALNTKTIKSAFVTDSCVTDVPNSGMESYPYRGTIWGNAIIQQIDQLISQGRTIVGGSLILGPLNDSEANTGYGVGHGLILQTAYYKSVPARFTVNSTAYQTMRVVVMILYY